MPGIRTQLIAAVLLLQVCVLEAQPVTLVNAFPGLTFTRPVLVTHAGDGSNRVFVVQQNGLIRVFPNDSTASSTTTFLNITAKLSATSGEEGLLGLAFHPNYAVNGTFYVNYTAPSPLRTVISRYTVSPGNPNRADSLSEQVLLQFNQPFSNHNGGMLFFGNDGYLYISTGDGGSGGDPQNNAQNTNVLLGKLLRIDVDTTGVSTPYGIPPGNPFAGGGGRPEIFAWGLRNPWRVSNDPVTGQIWAGDVGQNSWEEVDLIQAGGNYGWRCYEGNAPYDLTNCGGPSLYTFPLKAYSSQSPNPECSVTGGYIYRGQRRPDLVGRYIYGDYCSGKIWKFLYTGTGITEDTLLVDAPFSLSAFGTDEAGELYLCNYSSGTIHRFAGPPPTQTTSLVAPPDGALAVPLPVSLVWRSAAGRLGYWLQAAGDTGFTSPVVNDSTLVDTSSVQAGLSPGVTYSWRVRVRNVSGWGDWSAVRSFTTFDGITGTYQVPGGWSLIALPLDVSDPRAGTLFPGAASRPYAFSPLTGYVIEDSLRAGRGYWLKFDSAQSASISGRLRTADTISVEPGWNIIGGLSVPLDTAAVQEVPVGLLQSVFFDYSGSYQAADSLRPARGYWVRASGSGQLILGSSARRPTTRTPFSR